MHNVESTLVLLTVYDRSYSTHVTSSCAHNEVADFKLDEAVNLVGRLDGTWVGCTSGSRCNRGGGKKELDGVVDLDGWVGVSDGSAIVSDDVRDTSCTELDAADLAELVLALLLGDAVDCKSSLDVVHQTEVLARLLEGDDVHESSRVGVVGSDFSIDLDESLGNDEGDLTASQSVLELVAEEDA